MKHGKDCEYSGGSKNAFWISCKKLLVFEKAKIKFRRWICFALKDQENIFIYRICQKVQHFLKLGKTLVFFHLITKLLKCCHITFIKISAYRKWAHFSFYHLLYTIVFLLLPPLVGFFETHRVDHRHLLCIRKATGS